MALVSHIHKFIYIKNRKVAGSSVESFFGRYCCDPNSGYNYEDKINVKKSKYGIIGGRWQSNHTKSVWAFPHIKAKQINKEIGKKYFDEYFKFSVVRNPWDKMVSRFYWDLKHSKNFHQLEIKNMIKKNAKIEEIFTYYILNKAYDNHSDWKIHTIQDKPICDFYIKYETLNEDIIEVCNKIGIDDFDLSLLPTHKSSVRKKTNYRDFYNDKTYKIIKNLFKKEINYFKYKI